MSSDNEFEEHDDETIESTLRKNVQQLYDTPDLTINRIRTAVEKKLGLETDYLKNDNSWSKRSKDIIKDAINQVTQQRENKGEEGEKTTQDDVKGTNKQASKATSKPRRDSKTSTKRSSVAKDDKARKRQKTKSIVSDDEEDSMSKLESDNERQAMSAHTSEHDDEPVEAIAEMGPDSELPDVIDEPIPKRKKKGETETNSTKKNSDKSAKPVKPKTASKKTSKVDDLTPDEAEIKRLQSWLLKCGIRKLWHKELAKCESDKAKIRHLKGMLENVGMTGRYSEEKAKMIKERRELAADLEAVQEGNEKWGKESDSEVEQVDGRKSQARRPSARSKLVDFGSDGEDEE